jgi:hypothetical protein
MVEGLEEDFLVYAGTLRSMIPLRFTKKISDPLSLRYGWTIYQAFTPTVCFPPATPRVDVPLNGLDLIRD